MLPDLLFDYTLRTVALGAAVLGIVSGVLGSFAVLRRQSLLGDAISHAALPGIVIAFMLTGSKAPLVLVVGAGLAGWAGTLLVMSVVRTTRIKHDSALGIVLSVFFGVGLMLLTFIQRRPDASQAGLDRFLFGQAAALVAADVRVMAILGLVALAAVALLWKEFKLLSFDPEFASSVGYSVRSLDVVLTGLLVVAIVIGLQTVGVVLMSAMVVAPGAAARQWTNHLGRMVLLAALFGAASGVAGAVLSSSGEALPTGPLIVLCVSAVVLVSLLVAPGRGLLWGWAVRRRNRARLRTDVVLGDLHTLASQHAGDHAHPAAVLETMNAEEGTVAPSLQALERRGLARRVDDGWVLTERGRREAERSAPRADDAQPSAEGSGSGTKQRSAGGSRGTKQRSAGGSRKGQS